MKVGVTSPRQLVRKSLCALLSGLEGVSAVDVSSPSELVESLKTAAPDVVLLDTSDPETDIDTVSQLRAMLPNVPILMLTDDPKDDYQYHAICRGARGFMSKDCTPELLERALRAMAEGQMWIGHDVASHVISRLLQRESGEAGDEPLLSPREQEILALVAEGYRNKEIAGVLSISENTIRAHVASLYRKIQVGGRVEAALYYFGKSRKNGRSRLPAAAGNGSHSGALEAEQPERIVQAAHSR